MALAAPCGPHHGVTKESEAGRIFACGAGARPLLIEAMAPAAAETAASELARALEEFFAEYPRATVLEDGHVLFDMAAAHFSISTEQGRCLLHLWSDERNLVRTVCGLKARKDSLRVETRRFGQAKPQVLEIAANRDRRVPSSRESSRAKYLRMLDRALGREFPDWKAERTAHGG